MPTHPQSPSHNGTGAPLQRGSSHAIESQHVDQGIDRINLRQIKERFESLNKSRLDRLYATASTQRRQFIDLLPLLFHLNHPVLPGYISQATPCGLRDYRPSRESIKSARILSKSFALQRDLNPSFDICSIYIMGSCGSVADSNQSDMDIWICPRQDMDRSQRELLAKKCNKIAEWAGEFGLESHFFVMDDKEFREQERAEMQGEDCGSTQHFLLLDEFYRTGLLVAGCPPIWWLVPANFEGEYQHYVNELCNKRFVNDNSYVDFGSARNIPVQEFLSAGIWQLYKGLDAPYKSILKLLLIEVYASEYPYTKNLSQSLKNQVYRGDTNIDELDPYVQIYRRLEDYLLQRNEPERLELVRRCFYYKVGIALSRSNGSIGGTESTNTVTTADKNSTNNNDSSRDAYWRHSIIARLTRQWGWTKQDLIRLDQRNTWPLQEIKTEHNKLTTELNRSYRLLTSLLRNHQSSHQDDSGAASKDLTLLGRKLYAAFERKANKVPRFNHGTSEPVKQDTISLRLDDRIQGESQWQVFAGKHNLAGNNKNHDSVIPLRTIQRKQTTGNTPLYQSADLVETLAWCVINGLLTVGSKLDVIDGEHDLTGYEARALQSQLLQSLPTANGYTQIDDSAFSKPAIVEKCLFFINAGIDPLAEAKQNGIHRISDHTDPLAYGSNHENLVVSITLVTYNSWGEVFCYHYLGEDALDQCLVHYFCYAKPGREAKLPDKKIICACASRATAISDRIGKLFEDIENCYFKNTGGLSPGKGNETSTLVTNSQGYQNKRFVFESATAYHLMSWPHGSPEIHQYKNEKALLKSLSDPHSTGPLVVEPRSLRQHPLSIVSRSTDIGNTSAGEAENQAIKIYFEVQGDYADTYIIDSNRSLSTTTIPFSGTRTFIIQLGRFIEQCIGRYFSPTDEQLLPTTASSFIDTNTSSMPTLKFYRLGKNGQGYSSTLIPTESELGGSYLPVQAIGTIGITGTIDWAIYCNDELFDRTNYGDKMYHRAASAIYQHRSSQQDYPCYVTDIDIAGNSPVAPSLARDFYYKRQLEKQLQQAMDELAK